MSDLPAETVNFGGNAPESRRRRYVVGGLLVALLIVGVAAFESYAGWFDPKHDDHHAATTASTVPSTPRALTAAVLAHIPNGVTVVWSSGARGSGQGIPGIGPAANLRHRLTSSMLLRVGSDEFFLSVTTGPHNQALVPDGLGKGLITRDKQGRGIRETMAGSLNGVPTVITESASPRSEGPLPLSDGELEAILADPLVGVQTDAATLARSQHLSSYTDSPPTLTWVS
jgi:hypothetical protein